MDIIERPLDIKYLIRRSIVDGAGLVYKKFNVHEIDIINIITAEPTKQTNMSNANNKHSTKRYLHLHLYFFDEFKQCERRERVILLERGCVNNLIICENTPTWFVNVSGVSATNRYNAFSWKCTDSVKKISLFYMYELEKIINELKSLMMKHHNKTNIDKIEKLRNKHKFYTTNIICDLSPFII